MPRTRPAAVLSLYAAVPLKLVTPLEYSRCGALARTALRSSSVMLQYVPLLKPLYDMEREPGNMPPMFEDMPAKLRFIMP